ncbi:g11151 [Coccomyxa viridis]|uniref:G11151 protein n=1 Tax=Coccomyxa viridis TaxID=1274662 RepID=A0ABP1GD20_9CHLO
MAMAATISTASPTLLHRGGVASTSSRCRAQTSPATCMFRAPSVRIYSTPTNAGHSARREQSRRPRAGSCGTYGPFTWSSGGYAPGNTQAWEAMLRMWGINPESQRWQEMMRDFKRGESVFNQAAGDFTSAVILPVDIEDVGDAYNFVADVPGLEKGDIKIQVNQEERQLTLSGERRRAKASAEEGNEDSSKQNPRRSERRFGKFERKFKLPEDADTDAVTARVEKGVLTVMIRKSEAAANNLRDVQID